MPSVIDTACALCASEGKNRTFNQAYNYVLVAGGGGTEVSDEIKQVGQIYGTDTEPNPMAGRVYSAEGISPCLDTMRGGNRMPKILENIPDAMMWGCREDLIVRPCLTPDREEKRQNGRRFKEDGEEMFTLTAQDKHGVLLDDGSVIRIRKLTPKECFRLQGWTDDYFEKAQFVNSDSQLYKQAGNGVTVTVIQAIAERME